MSDFLCPGFLDRGQFRVKQIRDYFLREDELPMLVLGLPGMGKTTLLEQIADPSRLKMIPRERGERTNHERSLIPIYCQAAAPITWRELIGQVAQHLPVDDPRRPKVMQLELLYSQAKPFPQEAIKVLPADKMPGAPEQEAAAGTVTDERPDNNGTWLGYFAELETEARDLTILFLLDDLDQVSGSQESTPDDQASFERLLALSERTNVKVLAASTRPSGVYTFKEMWLPPFFDDDILALVAEKFGPESDRDRVDSVTHEVLAWTGGVPTLVCSYLHRYDSQARNSKLPAPDRRVWLAESFSRWYTSLALPILSTQDITTLKKLASLSSVYTIDAQKRPHEAESVNALVNFGLVEEQGLTAGTEGPPSSYTIRSIALKEHLRGTVQKRGRWAQYSPRPFTSNKFAVYTSAAWVLALVTMLVLEVFVGRRQLLGLIWMLPPLIYGVYGLLQPPED